MKPCRPMMTTIPVKADDQPAFNEAGFCLPPPPPLARSAPVAHVLIGSKHGTPAFTELAFPLMPAAAPARREAAGGPPIPADKN